MARRYNSIPREVRAYNQRPSRPQAQQLDTISLDVVGKLDNAWINTGMPDNGIRTVTTKTATLFTIPNTDNAPVYRYRTHNPVDGTYAPTWYHVGGPTLADYQRQQEQREASRDAADLYAWASGR